MEDTLLFTYGTLRVGQYNAPLIQDTGNYKETVKSVKSFIMVTSCVDSFPYLIDPDHWPEMRHMAVKITGDIYSVNSKGISMCDHLEGHPTWYCRTTIEVINKANVKYSAQAYILTQGSFNNLSQNSRSSLNILKGDWLASKAM
jgi:gamma-glutamylcyclotransferase (GGCT)/AIG2-like uncharacterized protein YtfP